jgi:ribonuclease HII
MLKARFQKKLLEAGTDEAGRGCLAGPVTAAAVILPTGFRHPLLNDSKQLTEAQRNLLRPIIEEKALAWAVSFISPSKIDQINILNASFLAMHRALARLETKPELILVDGNRFKPWKKVAYECIIKGDGKFLSIAAASVLAKTHRDERMFNLSKRNPGYGWEQNKGYPTKSHRIAIAELGPTKHHRRSFRWQKLPKQGELF